MDRELAKTQRHCQRTLRMVSELHKKGYQGLRIYPYQGSVGPWRLEIYPYVDFSSDNSLILKHTRESKITPARHSAGSDDYFFWSNSSNYNARQLADKFEKKFATLCHFTKGRDWEYAGWYTELLGEVEKSNSLPTIVWEGYKREIQDYQYTSPTFLPLKGWDDEGYFQYVKPFPLPPSSNFHEL